MKPAQETHLYYVFMAKTKSSKKKTDSEPGLFTRLTSAVHNDTVLFVTGTTIALFALFVCIACVSFLFTGGTDQSIINTASDTAGTAIADVANNAGRSGARLSETIINHWFGIPSFLMLAFLFVTGTNIMKVTGVRIWRWFVSCTFLTFWLSILFTLVLTPIMKSSFIVPGGNHGINVSNWLLSSVGVAGTVLILLLTILMFCIWLTRSTITWIRNKLSFTMENSGSREEKSESYDTDESDGHYSQDSGNPDSDSSWTNGRRDGEDSGETVPNSGDDIYATSSDESAYDADTTDVTRKDSNDIAGNDIELEVIETVEEEQYEGKLPEPYNPRLDLSHYKFPTLDLLKEYDNIGPTDNKDEQQANKNRIIAVLRSFGIEITSISATQGPTVTLYEITPAEGVRISKIRNLEDDIALSLAALGIRIIAPIPGKGTIGIEVPNANPVMVPMQSIISSRKFVESNYQLPVALGRTITNEIFMFDLAKMPHLLVAGATGMGKSVGLNAIVTSLLYKKHPAEMKLVMVDPKMVEFSIYGAIEKHFLAKLPDANEPIITDPTKVVHTLKSLCTEMDSRYELLKNANVRSIIEYNELFISRKLNPMDGHRYLPYIVVVIDEFGDLIMTAGKEIETPICRIAQKARAVGMHMIIATQRPTTNIITGTIKANFPARIAFRVTSMIDSRTILDRPGANQLIGRGDMLFSQGGDPTRVQCAFVDTPEVQNICSYISRQQGYVTAYELPEYVDENEGGGMEGESLSKGDLDPIFEDAARLIVNSQQGSTSLIQRKFKIGYNRAGRIMDQLERAGIVSAQEGSKPRQVLCMDEIELEQKLQNME